MEKGGERREVEVRGVESKGIEERREAGEKERWGLHDGEEAEGTWKMEMKKEKMRKR